MWVARAGARVVERVAADPARASAAFVDVTVAERRVLRAISRAERGGSFQTAYGRRRGSRDLPPDNFQEQPPVGVAHRTSPTNIGLALLANLAAHDFGYIDVDRRGRAHRAHVRETLDQLAALPRPLL